MARVPVVGGPYCGKRTPESQGPFRWIDKDGIGHSQPRPGRVLYRLTEGEWRFAGAGARVCPGCGAIIDADPATGVGPDACPLCGA